MKYLFAIFILLASCRANVPVPSPGPITTPVAIAVLNQSTVVSDSDVAQAVSAVQIQFTRDFIPAWGLPTTVAFYPASTTPPNGSWLIYIRDNSTRPHSNGYHEQLTGQVPSSYVFAASAIASGTPWTTTLSHESMELRVDPALNIQIQESVTNPPLTLSEEIADPVAANYYDINGVLVSDFTLPSWWSPTGTAPFNQLNNLTGPFQLAFGGSYP